MEKKEDANETIKEIETEKEVAEGKKQKKPKRARFPLAVKIILLLAVFFSVIITGSFVFLVVAASHQLGEGYSAVVNYLVVASIVVGVIGLLIFIGIAFIVSWFTLRPIRKITKSIKEITAQDLKKRITSIDSQDELLELTRGINKMLDNIEESFIRQENFVADASHELKTPLSVISGYANLLKRWGSTDKAVLKEAVEVLCRESENMQHIIAQLLLLAKIGNFTRFSSKFNLDIELYTVVEHYQVTNKTHSILYKSNGRLEIETDKSLLITLVRAFIDNAISYTKAGGHIQVSLYKKEEEDEVIISVRDSGMGISNDDMPYIFDRFYRCDKARSRERGGTGLGLTIAKSISEILEGKIEVVSELGKGSEFLFKLNSAVIK